jgi:hypothetical protein
MALRTKKKVLVILFVRTVPPSELGNVKWHCRPTAGVASLRMRTVWVRIPPVPLQKGKTMKCLKCERELKILEPTSSNIDDGGDMEVTFHYGSRHDMCLGFSGRKTMHSGDSRLGKLLSCDVVRAYICDDCFEKHVDLFQGFDVIRPRPEEKKIVE